MNNQPKEKTVQAVPGRKRRSCLGCLGRGAILLAGLLVVLLAAGAIYQAATSASDLKKYPATGKLYDIGDYSLHLTCTGTGSPTVILEAGSGTPGLTWASVQDEIKKSTRVCSYDRAGYGYSESAPGPLSPQQVASDLHALLEKANVPGPYIMVGHSAGGVYVRAYASQYPSEVVGMVLVDSSHEGENLVLPPEWVKLNQTQNTMMSACQVMSPFGLMRLSHMFDAVIAGVTMDPQIGAAYLAATYQTRFCRVSAEEVEALAATPYQPDTPGKLGDMPLIVLTADTSEAQLQAQVPGYLKSTVGSEVVAKVFQTNREMQKSLVGLSSRGRQEMVPNSGHMIQLEQPGVVIDAIREVMEQVRGGI
jgi:pimeloyl-ACP methyl ester carboxylesterase